MDFEKYEEIIQKSIAKYEKHEGKGKQSRDLFKAAKAQIDMYHLFLSDNEAASLRFQWLTEQKDRLNKIKQEKNLVTNKDDALKIINTIHQQTKSAFGRMEPKIEEAIKVSTYIQIQLQRQIQELDQLYKENKQGSKRLRKAKRGLKTIIKRAMMNKCTRALAIITVLALIGLIVVYILKDNGVF